MTGKDKRAIYLMSSGRQAPPRRGGTSSGLFTMSKSGWCESRASPKPHDQELNLRKEIGTYRRNSRDGSAPERQKTESMEKITADDAAQLVQDGDAILIADRRDESSIKQLVELLQKKGLEKYL